MKENGGSWKNGKVENHRLIGPVVEARKNLGALTDEDIQVIWREFRQLLSSWVNTRLDDPRNIPPQMETHAFQGEFLPLHSKYTDHELFIGALINEYSPLIEFGKKHTYQKILSICIIKEALYGSAETALSAGDGLNRVNKLKGKINAGKRSGETRLRKKEEWEGHALKEARRLQKSKSPTNLTSLTKQALENNHNIKRDSTSIRRLLQENDLVPKRKA